jgi:hypothetical protein
MNQAPTLLIWRKATWRAISQIPCESCVVEDPRNVWKLHAREPGELGGSCCSYAANSEVHDHELVNKKLKTISEMRRAAGLGFCSPQRQAWNEAARRASSRPLRIVPGSAFPCEIAYRTHGGALIEAPDG